MAVALSSHQETLAFERIVDVRYRSGMLTISFADGSEANVPVHRLQTYGIAETEWPTVMAEAIHIRIATANGDVEIPWDVLRFQSDDTFRAEWDNVMRDANREAGRRLRALRESRDERVSQLADRIGVSEADIRALEAGEPTTPPGLDERILTALGFTYADLAAIE